MKNYSINSSTYTMGQHLYTVHNIKATKSQEKVGGSETTNIAKFLQGAKTEKLDLNKDLVKWFCVDLLPFSTVKKDGFQYFFKRHMKQLTLPDESTLRKTTLIEVYEEIKTKLVADLHDVHTINLMFDGWTDAHHKCPYLGLRISYLNKEWEYRIATVSCKILPVHTGESVAQHVRSELDQILPKGRKEMSIFSTHDGAANMKKCSEKLKVKDYQHCAAHSLHLLIMNDGINKIPAMKFVLENCKSVVRTLQFKGSLLEENCSAIQDLSMVEEVINKVHKELDLDESFPVGESDEPAEAAEVCTYSTLKTSVITRWNSNLTMIESILKILPAVNNSLKMTGNYDLCLTDEDKEILIELKAFLQTFKELTDIVSANEPHLGLIPLMKSAIVKACRTKDGETGLIRDLKTAVLRNVEKRFKISNSVRMACLCDPSLKDTLGMSKREQLEFLQAAAAELVLQSDEKTSETEGHGSDAVMEPDSDHTSKRRKLIAEMQDSSINGAAEDCSEEITSYLTVKPTKEEQDDPLLFWKLNMGRYPIMGILAKCYLSLSASSVPVEAMFSTVGLVANGKRSALAPFKLNAISFIHDNTKLLGL